MPGSRRSRRPAARLVVASLVALAALAFASSALAIIGGAPAAVNTWNWNARLEVATPGGDEVCSGSVVAANVILTAAHCVVDETTNAVALASDVVVTTGRTTIDDPSSGQVLGVTRVAVYPSFSFATVRGDVALLQLAAPTTAQVIALAQPSDTVADGAGASTLVAGWGLESASAGTLPSQLQTVALSVQGNGLCASALADVALGFDPATMFCTVGANGSIGTCNGDSGGPAVGLNAAGGLIEIGVVSWNQPGCVHPDVFARLSALSGWLGPAIAAMQADATPPVTPPVVTPPATVPVAVPVTTTPRPATPTAVKVATAARAVVRPALHIHPVTAIAGGVAQLRFWAALRGARVVAHVRVLDRATLVFRRSTLSFAADGRARSIAWHVPRTVRGPVRFCMYATARAVSSTPVCAALTIRPPARVAG